MRISEKAEQKKKEIYSDKNIKKLKLCRHLILMNAQNIFLMLYVLLKEYNLFSPNNEISLEQ